MEELKFCESSEGVLFGSVRELKRSAGDSGDMFPPLLQLISLPALHSVCRALNFPDFVLAIFQVLHL